MKYLYQLLAINENIIGKERERPLLLLGLFLIYVLTVYLQLGSRFSILDSIRFEFVLGLILTIYSIFVIASDKTQYSQHANRLKNVTVGYLILMLFFVLFSFDSAHSWNIYFDRAIKFSLFGLFIIVFVRSPYSLALFYFVYMLAAFKLGLESFLGWKSGSLVWQNQGVLRLHGSIPILFHPNSLSGYAVGLLPFALFFFKDARPLFKAFLAVILIFSAIMIVFSASRTGYVATIVFIFYFFKSSQNKFKYASVAIVLGLVSLPLIPDQYVARFETIFTQQEIEGNSMGKRSEIISDSIEVFYKHPFGVGVGAFPLAREYYFDRKQDTHNLYLEVMTNMGIIGLSWFLYLIYCIFRVNKESLSRITILLEKSTTGGNQLRYIKNMLMALNGFLVVRLTLGLFGMDMYEIYWWFIIGTSLALSRIISYIESKRT